jgi:hemolysin activation/secretion protein
MSHMKMICLALAFICSGFVCSAAAAPRTRGKTETEKIERMREEGQRARREAYGKAEAKLAKTIAQIDLPEDTTQRFTVRRVNISGNTLISTDELLEDIPLIFNASEKPLEKAESRYLYDLRPLIEIVLRPGQAREVSAKTIQGFTQHVLSVYQNKNYAGIYVYVPTEAIVDGTTLKGEVLPVTVLEGRVTDVTVKSYDSEQNEVEQGYLSSSAVQEWSPLRVGEVANQKELDDFIGLLNLNPDRYVAAVVTKGAEEETLSVGYDIYEANPWHWFWQIDNAGTRDRQWAPRLGLINTNLLGIDDTFSAVYQAPWDSEIDEDYSIFGSYDIPLAGPRLRLNLYGGYSQYDVNPDTGTINFIGNGDIYGGILRYNLLQTDGWFLDVKGSAEHTRSKVTPSLFPSILGTDLQFWVWGWGLELHRSDDMSNTTVLFDRVESWGGESSGTEFALARTGAKSDFSIYRLAAAHGQYLDADKISRFSANGRWITSNERLTPAKMTTFGGMYTVRGYDEFEVVADGGILASAQYEFDLVKDAQAKDKAAAGAEQTPAEEPFLRKLAPLVFFDYGRAKVRHPLTTEKGHEEMFSVGVGTLVEVGANVAAGVYYGYPLRATDETKRGKGRLNIGVMVRW